MTNKTTTYKVKEESGSYSFTWIENKAKDRIIRIKVVNKYANTPEDHEALYESAVMEIPYYEWARMMNEISAK